MARLRYLIPFAFACTFFTSSAHAQNHVINNNVAKPVVSTDHHIRPLWVVTDLKSFDKSKQASEAAKKWLFTPLEIKNNAILFGNESCNDPEIKEVRIDHDKFEEKHQITLKDLGIEDSFVIAITTKCSNTALRALYRLDDRRILMKIDKDFLFLTPNIN